MATPSKRLTCTNRADTHMALADRDQVDTESEPIGRITEIEMSCWFLSNQKEIRKNCRK